MSQPAQYVVPPLSNIFAHACTYIYILYDNLDGDICEEVPTLLDLNHNDLMYPANRSTNYTNSRVCRWLLQAVEDQVSNIGILFIQV